jgi:hypothetical protein
MRQKGLSTTAPDGHPAKGEDFSPPILASRMRYVGTWLCFGGWQNRLEHVKKSAGTELEDVGLLSLKD